MPSLIHSTCNVLAMPRTKNLLILFTLYLHIVASAQFEGIYGSVMLYLNILVSVTESSVYMGVY